jgi:hypothetical protein
MGSEGAFVTSHRPQALKILVGERRNASDQRLIDVRWPMQWHDSNGRVEVERPHHAELLGEPCDVGDGPEAL